MRIVIDLQGAQTESRFRGIGRYSISFTKALIRNSNGHEIIVVLNGSFSDEVRSVRAELAGFLPQEQIRVWYAPRPVLGSETGNAFRREAAEMIREAFIASLEPDILHISSLFEGYVDDAITSIGRFDKSILVSVSLYDLIPLLNPEHYLKNNVVYEKYYLSKIDFLKNASLLLAISEYSKKEVEEGLVEHSSALVVNVSGAIDDFFQVKEYTDFETVAFNKKFSIERPFILYTGGADERKNLPNLIKAYASLPIGVREGYQLIFAGQMSREQIKLLRQVCKDSGVRHKELVFTGYVADYELVQFYNLCDLYVFPSWHEGFGLPPLEAMACGAPVIAANSTSLPEIVGNLEALFDPFSVEAMSEKILRGLTDEGFNKGLREQGLEQKKNFSWEESARKAVKSFEILHSKNRQEVELVGVKKPSLAYFSPLQPARSGISDYSAELLPALADFYDIDVVVNQDTISNAWITENMKVRSVQWFRKNAGSYDRILYHFGNSAFHEYMFECLEKFPGVVVLHDFFLSAVVNYMDAEKFVVNGLAVELYHSHGYKAVQERFDEGGIESVKLKYPCSFSVLSAAIGVIVHSENSRRLAKCWYKSLAPDKWSVIPLLRAAPEKYDREISRKTLGIGSDEFVICSFGFLDPTKLNHRLLNAWLKSKLSHDRKCKLIFVGENHQGKYGNKLLDEIECHGQSQRVLISGWADDDTFKHYLAASDVGVQLRGVSRGETSAAVLDCMNYGLPTIVNANGSMVDLPDEAVLMLAEDFTDEALIGALEKLWKDASFRSRLGKKSREVIEDQHEPNLCASQYFKAVEGAYDKSKVGLSALINELAKIQEGSFVSENVVALAESIAKTITERKKPKQLLLDISATYAVDLETGIERVVRALVLSLIDSLAEGYRVEPVYLFKINGSWQYRYARSYTLKILKCPLGLLNDEPVDINAGDVVVGLDVFGQGTVQAASYLNELRNRGVRINFVIFDLLPILMPEMFPPGASKDFEEWLLTVTSYDGAICISKAVAEELKAWKKEMGSGETRVSNIGWFHLGADINSSAPSKGLPVNAKNILKQIGNKPAFLMVGTIEPRKGHLQTIKAFELLWNKGVDVTLVIVGREGWLGLPESGRRNISEIVGKISGNVELGKRLLWLDGVSDEYLEKVYSASNCLIAASEGEGFGLPLIEAAKNGLQIIARDIPVFREVARGHALYFDNENDASTLSRAIEKWIELDNRNKEKIREPMPYLKWDESAEQLLNSILER